MGRSKLTWSPRFRKRRQRAQPVARGREHVVAHAERGQARARARSRSSAAAGAKRVAQPSAARVHAHQPAGLGSTSQSSPTFGSSCSRWIADLDRQHVVRGRRARAAAGASRGGRGSRRRRRPASAGARARPRASAPRRARSRPPGPRTARRGAPKAGRPAPSGPAAEAAPVGSSSPNVTMPSRFPRRVATWPIAIATPSATSALRRSAVPNCIEGEVSSTSQVTSTRSARCLADVRLARAGGDVPVDAPDVVARHVRPDLRELGAVAVDVARGSRRRAGPRCGVRCRCRARGAAPREAVRGRVCRACARPGVRSCRAFAPRQIDVRHRHGGDHRVEDRLGAHLLGERLVGEDEPVPQRVLRQFVQVLGQDVVAPADQRQRPGRLDEADRAARAGAVGDVRRELARARGRRARAWRWRARPRS